MASKPPHGSAKGEPGSSGENPGTFIIQCPGRVLVAVVAIVAGAILIAKGVDPAVLAVWLKVPRL